MMIEIDKIALILLASGVNAGASFPGQLLVARSKGKKLFYIPGGKRDDGETDHQTLVREIHEELGVSIVQSSIQYAHAFNAPADDKDKAIVSIACYYANIKGTPHPCQEIEEIKWVSFEDKQECSLVTQIIINWLHEEKKIHCRHYDPRVN